MVGAVLMIEKQRNVHTTGLHREGVRWLRGACGVEGLRDEPM